MHSSSKPLFLYDGDCGLCQNGTESMRRRFDPPVDMSAYQDVDLSAFGVTPDEALEGPILVRSDGSHIVGPLAIAEILHSSRRPYRLVGGLMLLMGVRHLLQAIGPSVYRQRYRLPGARTTCRMSVV